MKANFIDLVKRLPASGHHRLSDLFYNAVAKVYEQHNIDTLKARWEFIKDYVVAHIDDEIINQFTAEELFNISKIHYDAVVFAYNYYMQLPIEESKEHDSADTWKKAYEHIISIIDKYQYLSFEEAEKEF